MVLPRNTLHLDIRRFIMAIPQYGLEADGHGQGLDKKVGKVINCTGGAAVSLSASDSGAMVIRK